MYTDKYLLQVHNYTSLIKKSYPYSYITFLFFTWSGKLLIWLILLNAYIRLLIYYGEEAVQKHVVSFQRFNSIKSIYKINTKRVVKGIKYTEPNWNRGSLA